MSSIFWIIFNCLA